MFNVTVDGTGDNGKTVHWTTQCKFDGKPYKVEGNPSVDMTTYQKVNDRTNNTTGTKDGKTVLTGTITASKDGKSRAVTTTTTGVDRTKMTDKACYDKGQVVAGLFGQGRYSQFAVGPHVPDTGSAMLLFAVATSGLVAAKNWRVRMR